MWPFTKKDAAPDLADTVKEAAEQLHEKASKLETALDAVLVDDLRRLAAQERAQVRALTARKVFGQQVSPIAEESGMGDLIVADNIRIERSSDAIRSLVPMIGMAGAAAAAILWVALRGAAEPAAETPAHTGAPQRCVVDVWTTPEGVRSGIRKPEEPPLWESDQ